MALVQHTSQIFPAMLVYLQSIVKNFKGFKTSATVTISNDHKDIRLTDPESFFDGDIETPLGPVINPGKTPNSSKFTDNLTSRGMIIYNIKGQKGANWQPLYLIITWAVKKKVSGKNSISVNVLEYGTPPLHNNMTKQERIKLYNEIHKKNKIYANSTAKWPKYNNGALFSVRGNIDTKSDAKINIFFDQSEYFETSQSSL